MLRYDCSSEAKWTQKEWSSSVRIFIFLLAFSIAPTAHAETTVRGFLEEYHKATDDGKRLLDSFLSGLIAAYGWSNMALKTEELPPHFCPTARFGKEIEKPAKMIRRLASEETNTLDVPVGAALLTDLKRRFPCRESKE